MTNLNSAASLPSSPDTTLAVNDSSWQIETLVKAAYGRTKDRFLSYFLILVLSFAVGLGLLLVGGLSLFLVGLISALVKSLFLTVALGVFVTLTLLAVGAYLAAWFSLAPVAALINREKTDAVETFSRLRPKVWGYYFFTLFWFLFTLGLLPWGVLSFGVIFILWGFWGSFAAFVYLEKQKKYLSNLWYSRALVNQRFWGIAGRALIIYLAYYLIFFALSSSKSGLMGGLAFIFSILSGPFITSFLYEMYSRLPEVSEPSRPAVWMALSIIGWVVVFLSIFFLAAALPNLYGSIPWEQLRQSYPNPVGPLPTT